MQMMTNSGHSGSPGCNTIGLREKRADPQKFQAILNEFNSMCATASQGRCEKSRDNLTEVRVISGTGTSYQGTILTVGDKTPLYCGNSSNTACAINYCISHFWVLVASN